jgi:hypothetical protein
MLQIRMSPGRDVKPGPFECKAGVLPRRSVGACSKHSRCEKYTTNLLLKPEGKSLFMALRRRRDKIPKEKKSI